MADGLTIDTGQAARIAAALEDAAQQLADPDPLLSDIGAKVLADAGTRAPRRTGALAGSGHAAAGTVDGMPAQVLTWGVRYGLFVNFGTRHMRAQPFATDALTAATATAEPMAGDWATTILEGVH